MNRIINEEQVQSVNRLVGRLVIAGLNMATEEDGRLSNLGTSLISRMQEIQGMTDKEIGENFDRITREGVGYLQEFKTSLGTLKADLGGEAINGYQNMLRQCSKELSNYGIHTKSSTWGYTAPTTH